ncbi:hypothetical protein ACFO4E_13825 [Nocardiopsis mangrovi]|uniref:Uncharacterized protein n=1 Tax=Nocardiopsis mangrovi TaxID=1179818 RepID=A0ABV9DW41_9ACTN
MNAVVTIGSARLDGKYNTAEQEPFRFDDIAQVSEGDMRERFLLDEVRMRIGTFNFIRPGSPLLDFCMSLQSALRGLAVSGKSAISFPGTLTQIRLALIDDTVHVRSTSEAHGRGECTFIRLMGAVCVFQRSALDNVTREDPNLLLNDLVERLYREYGVRQLGKEQFARHTQAVRRRHGV